MIESDLLSRREKARNIKQLSLSSWRCMGKEGECSDKIYRDRFGALTKIAHFGPLSAKIAFCGPASLALRFQWFQRNFVDFGNTFFCENEARHQKTQKWWWVRHEKYIWAFFPKPRFWPSCCKFETDNVRTPIFPQFWEFLHIAKKSRLHTLSNPEEDAIYKEQNCALNNLIFGMVPQDHATFTALLHHHKSCDPSNHLQGVSGPFGPEITKESQKESFWGSAKKSPQIAEKVENTQNWTFFGNFSTLSGIFGDFLADSPKRLFLRFFFLSGPEGPGNSCKWSLGSQHKTPRANSPSGSTRNRGLASNPTTFQLSRNHWESIFSNGGICRNGGLIVPVGVG